MTIEEVEARINELENSKSKLIGEIKKNYGRIRYKKYEEKALEPFLKETENVMVGPVRKKLRRLEFKIATQAYTPQIERQLVKEVKKVEDELKELRAVEKARRKKKLVKQDIEECENRILEIEEELKGMRSELKDLYAKRKTLQSGKKHGVIFGEKPDDMVSMEDIVVIEDIRDKEKKED
ncbi:hypothetical protein GF412_02135 [Candidatus Micrarchaeota archaeon]|nr:hypothetical protein [Candidatus Micrarchaeota archaeon]MBD3417761.1 hypothetical protein [Candidatus Micrarchaeota archaeon]